MTTQAVSSFGIVGPLPQAEPLTEEFWAACREQRLVLQRCDDCKTFQHPPEIICHNCRSEQLSWQPVAETGTVYTVVNVTHRVYPGTEERIPYNVVLVEVDDTGGTRVYGNVVNASFEEINIGDRVRLVWDQVEEDVVLPRWALMR